MTDIKTETIDTTEHVAELVDLLVLQHDGQTNRPTMYIDLEGVSLCRNGTISIFTLMIDTPTFKQFYLLDVHTLGEKAFNTAGLKDKTLKDILQDAMIPKVFFDVRNDSDALFAHYGIALQGIEDVQLIESASRPTTFSRRHVGGLAKCIEQHALATGGDKAKWKQAKDEGEMLFKPEIGGSYEVVNQRPISEAIAAYCVGDVRYLPILRQRFWEAETDQVRGMIVEESSKRVWASQQPEYEPRGRHKALGPWTKKQNNILNRFAKIL